MFTNNFLEKTFRENILPFGLGFKHISVSLLIRVITDVFY